MSTIQGEAPKANSATRPRTTWAGLAAYMAAAMRQRADRRLNGRAFDFAVSSLDLPSAEIGEQIIAAQDQPHTVTQTSRALSLGPAGHHPYSRDFLGPTRGTTTAPACWYCWCLYPPNSVKATTRVAAALDRTCHPKLRLAHLVRERSAKHVTSAEQAPQDWVRAG